MKNPLLLDLPATLETERLLLRTPQAGDGAIFLAALKASLPELRRYLGFLPWVKPDPTLESAELYCRTTYIDYLNRKNLLYFIFEKSSGQLLGAAGLYRIDWTLPKAEVGYWSNSATAGHGFISEAVLKLIDFAFQELAMLRLELVSDEDNLASRQLAERCQFELEGILRKDRKAEDGTLSSSCMYARLATR
ncbi:GNAT family N-acetyltransferase [Undibacterium sp. Ren11W]|uniref:GNAT family N-acetyltransferase n=1 Tax=Undibacterium sp. Ren11W TaxID=3413045 RepID=UPI003BF37785